jgi:tRNA pseudouridine55 synthase
MARGPVAMPRLVDHLKSLGLSNRQAHDLLETGKISYYGMPTADGGREVDLAHVTVSRSAARLKPNRDLAVIFRDAHLAIVCKPSGMLSVDAPGRRGETNVIGAVRRLFGAAFPVHRLDEPTSGLMMVALSAECQRQIKELLFEHQIERRYLALVRGAFPSTPLTVRSELIRNRGDGLRGSATEADEDGAREAVTHLKLIERVSAQVSLVEAKLDTGRTHQVRIHLSEQGFPILGDELYGKGVTAKAAPRLALHACTLGLRHPFTGQSLSFVAPLADDLERLRRRLAQDNPPPTGRRAAPRPSPSPPAALEPGILLVHKDVGPTSSEVLRALETETASRSQHGRKLPLCHGGALDPFAEGLLLVLVGPATRLMDLHHAIPKVYEAEVVWGVETDNGDLHGRAVREGDPTALTAALLDAALAAFLGFREQIPPAHSNKRIDGERAYVKAHRGETVELPASQVYLHRAAWLSHDLPRRSRLSLVCRGGYYVRALSRDLGRALGCGAHLARLQRTAIGPWLDPPSGTRQLLRGEALLPWCRSRELTADEARHLGSRELIERGYLVPPSWSLPDGFPDPQAPIRAMSASRLVGLLYEEGEALRPSVLLGRGV